jgi:hypothetical protein
VGVTVFLPPTVVTIEVAREYHVGVVGDNVVREVVREEFAHRVNGFVVVTVVVGVDN